MRTTIESEPLVIHTPSLKKASLFFRAINHDLRRQILQLLHKKGRVMVTEIYVKLRLEQSVTSQHLSILRQAKLVNAEREGKKIYYSVNYEQVKLLHNIAGDLLNN